MISLWYAHCKFCTFYHQERDAVALSAVEGYLWLCVLLQMKCVRDKDYVPNFKTAFEHFLVHTGGRAVIEEVEKKLRLDPADVQPSKETLYRYGNTCCAAVFYVLTNMESRVRAGSRRTADACVLHASCGHCAAHW